ncbi:hypothetical protein QAD02_010066 [Eretmocerus hayati]|uniref:Uncharacterized protein n=2 Tax=Eretmocerus hayati TaxID=131215 RepID=A0ACC2NB42_9HYME|nr:hypothetical protein QAD02_010065 [Eretmocerus hayati]KAJ8668403.1 hypothetical protein QAD02_010066 [Eretmocerus hayati]
MTLSNLTPWLMLITYMALVSFPGIHGSSHASERSSRSKGGFNAPIEGYPFMVSIRYAGAYVCGGAIISPDVILTTAWCIPKDYFLDLFYIKVGHSDINSNGTWHRVAKVLKHEEYGRIPLQEGDEVAYQNVNDIALLKLVAPIKIDNKTTRIIELLRKSDEMHYHDSGVLSSWGKYPITVNRSVRNPRGSGTITRTEVVTRYPANLKYVELDIGSAHKCSGMHPSADLNGQFCTYTLGRVPCEGDFGSPLVVDGKVAGLASWTSGKCDGDSNVAYFTDVAKFNGWINEMKRRL